MNREDYIKMRNLGKFSSQKFYAYYVEQWEKLKQTKGYKTMLSYQDFKQVFAMVFRESQDEIIAHLDKVFNVYIMEGKWVDGQREIIEAF